MAVLSPTVVGQIYKAEVDFSGTNAWLNHLPIIDGTASTVDFNDNFNYSCRCYYKSWIFHFLGFLILSNRKNFIFYILLLINR